MHGRDEESSRVRSCMESYMKKGQAGEGFVEKVIFPNKGVVAAGEERVIVKNALPGQKVRFSVNKVRRGKA